MNDSRTITVVEEFSQPPSRVWQALTTADLLGRWLMPNDFVAEMGHEFSFHGVPMPGVGFSGEIRCRVLELIIDRRLALAWTDAERELDWTVTFTLEAADGGTRLTLVHDGFDPDDPYQRLARTAMGAGWRPALRKLAKLTGEEWT